MISRRPMWMLLVTCVLLSSGPSMALAASQKGLGSQAPYGPQGEWLLSQAPELEAEESSRDETEGGIDRPTLSLDSSGPLVIQIQVLLQEQGLYSGTVNGEFNADTVKAVKAFQTENGLEPTGSVDSATWGPLTGEIAEPEAEVDASEEAPPSQETAASDAGPSTQLRLLIAVAALIGLGAGGFGLWKMLSVPVPQPLAYPDGEDDDNDYMDDLNGEPDYSSQAMKSRRESPNDYSVSPITVPASLTARAPQGAALTEELAGEIEGEQVDFSGLEEIELPNSPGGVPKTVTPANRDEAPVMQAAPQRGSASAGPREITSVDKRQTAPEDLDVAQETAHHAKIALQQAIVQNVTGHGLAEAKIAAAQNKRQPKSATDTAVEIATQSARAAARHKTSTAAVQKTNPAATQSVSTVATPQRKASASQAEGQRKASLAKASIAKPGKNLPGQTFSPLPPPPPAPSEIVRSAPTGSLEQPELVTTPLMGRVDIVETLITDLQGADPAKRRKAIWELGQRCDSRAIQPLVNMMANSDSRQRSLILAALSEIGTQTLKPMKQALAISLQDDNAEVRKNAIRDLTRIYDLVAQISHLLNSALDDPDPEVQDTARWALKQLNRIRSNAGLEGSSEHPILQQSVSPPESFSGETSRKARSLPKS